MLNKYLIQDNSPEVNEWINVVLKKYLKTNLEEQGKIEHCLDYFRSNGAGKNILSIGVKQAIRKSEKWVERLNTQAVKDVETEEDIETALVLPDGFKIVKLLSDAAFKREGKLMSHCAGSYASRGSVELYSLRDSFNKPHCTLEVNSDDVNQIKGKGNGPIHPKYIKHVLAFLDHVGKSVRPSEMEYLGYLRLEGDDLEMFNKVSPKFTGFKTLNYGGEFYVFSDSKPELIK